MAIVYRNPEMAFGHSSEWTSENPTLAVGVRGVETDTLQSRVGDGTTAWNDMMGYDGPETTQRETDRFQFDYTDNAKAAVEGFATSEAAAAQSAAQSFATNAVNAAKQTAANSFKGNNTGSAAAMSDLSKTQAKALLDIGISDVNGLTAALGALSAPQRTTVTTNAAGAATWTFPSAFGSAPIISATPQDNTAATAVDVKVTAVSTTAVSIQVNKAANVLGILTLAATPGATVVHLVATAS